MRIGTDQSVQELRNLMAPLDPASADRLTDAELAAGAVPLATVLIRAKAAERAEPGFALPDAPAQHTHWYRRRVLRWAVPGVVVALAGGAVAAATLTSEKPASVPNLVRCFSVDRVTSDWHFYADTSMASAPGGAAADNSRTVASALDACAANWQVGLLVPGGKGTAHVENGAVPTLVACVLGDGTAAVFPGTDQTCKENGLARLIDRK